jgi:hypothetical protein
MPNVTEIRIFDYSTAEEKENTIVSALARGGKWYLVEPGVGCDSEHKGFACQHQDLITCIGFVLDDWDLVQIEEIDDKTEV